MDAMDRRSGPPEMSTPPTNDAVPGERPTRQHRLFYRHARLFLLVFCSCRLAKLFAGLLASGPLARCSAFS